MRVCIVGGGKVGYYLAKTLIENSHDIIVIEKNKLVAEKFSNSLGVPVVLGDGTSLESLSSVKCEECDALVAVSGRDECNLIACQLAKKVYDVPKTISRVNNPKNSQILKQMGIDITISSTDNIARLLEREVETDNIKQLIGITGDNSINEILINEKFPFNGKTLMEIPVPKDSVIISVTRKGELIIPRGHTNILVGDRILCLASDDALHKLVVDWKLDK